MPELDYLISSSDSIRIDSIEKGRPYISQKPRDHSSIVFIIEGVLIYSSDTECFRAPENSVLYIEDGKLDTSESEGEYVKYIYINFKALKHPDFSPEGIEQVSYPLNPVYIKQQFINALEIWREHDFGYKPRCTEIVYSIINNIAHSNYQKTSSYYKYAKVKPAIIKLEKSYSENLTVSMLASLCDMSTSGFLRLFSEVTGKTPGAYLAYTRINNAVEYIKSGAYNMTEIAALVGFADVYSFSRAFKKLRGVPPTKFME